MPDHQPQATPPTKPAPEPATAGVLMESWPASLAPQLAPGGPIGMPRHPPCPGSMGRADRPARQ
jgi:hypothetical protein